MDLDSLRIFLAVADYNGLLAAARALELPKQTVSRKLLALEDEVGVPLIDRERRPLELSPAGARFAEHGRELLERAQLAVREARAERFEPRGELRVAAPQLFVRELLAPIACKLARRHPQLRLRIVASDDLDPALPWNYDAVVWVGDPPDVHWRARQLGVAHNVLCAAPSLLEAHEALHDPRALGQLPVINYTRRQRHRQRWILTCEAQRIELDLLEPRLDTNEPQLALRAAIEGLGVTHLPGIVVDAHLRSGELVRVLPEWGVYIGPIVLLVRSHAHPPARVQALLEALEELEL